MLRLGNAPIALHIPQQELSAGNASSSHALAAVFQKKTFAENYTNPPLAADIKKELLIISTEEVIQPYKFIMSCEGLGSFVISMFFA